MKAKNFSKSLTCYKRDQPLDIKHKNYFRTCLEFRALRLGPARPLPQFDHTSNLKGLIFFLVWDLTSKVNRRK